MDKIMTEKNPIITTFTKNDLKLTNCSEPFTMTYKWVVNAVEEINESILEFIYEEYLKSDVDKVILLDKTEFRKFLMKYIPIYMKEKEENDGKEPKAED